MRILCAAFPGKLKSGTFWNPLLFSQKYRRYKWEAYCGTNGRRTAVQIGGVLRRFPFFKAWKPARHSVTNGGGALRYKLEVYRQYLDGRNRAIVIAESLAIVIAAIRLASVRWSSDVPPKTQDLVLMGAAFVVLRFESRDWRSLGQYSFHVELRNGLRELAAFAEH